MPLQTDTTILNIPADTLRTDSLSLPVFDTTAHLQALPATVDASEVFGDASVLHDTVFFDPPTDPILFSDLIYQIPVICVLIGYFIYVLAYGNRILPFLKLRVSARSDEHDPEEYIRMFSGFVNGLWAGGWLMLGVTAAKLYSIWMPEELDGRLSPYFPFLITVGIMIVGMGVGLLQQFLLRMTGRLTLNTHFTGRILSIRRFTFISFTIIATPVSVVFSLAPPTWMLWTGLLLATIAIVYIIYLLYRTLLLFFQEKVSILLWFLYLCGVEVMPYAVLATALLRSVPI